MTIEIPAHLKTATPTLWQWRATGTEWRIYHSGGVDAETAQEAANAVERDEALWSRFRGESDVSRINRAAGCAVRVDAETVTLVSAACWWNSESGGLFDPLIGRSLHQWGYKSSFRQGMPGPSTSPAAGISASGCPTIDTRRNTISIPHGTMLDLGGIAKSWIAVRVASLLDRLCDDPSLLVDAGGDLVAARGDHLVAVDDSAETKAPIAYARLPQGWGAATSAWQRRAWQTGDGRTAHHLIDPETGAPGVHSHATVLAANPVAADVLATLLALRPSAAPHFTQPCRARLGETAWESPSWQTALVT
jgi:thiamine biosynthesis lipoprotein